MFINLLLTDCFTTLKMTSLINLTYWLTVFEAKSKCFLAMFVVLSVSWAEEAPVRPATCLCLKIYVILLMEANH